MWITTLNINQSSRSVFYIIDDSFIDRISFKTRAYVLKGGGICFQCSFCLDLFHIKRLVDNRISFIILRAVTEMDSEPVVLSYIFRAVYIITTNKEFPKRNGRFFPLPGVNNSVPHGFTCRRPIPEIVADQVILPSFACINVIATPIINDIVSVINQLFRCSSYSIKPGITAITVSKQI